MVENDPSVFFLEISKSTDKIIIDEDDRTFGEDSDYRLSIDRESDYVSLLDEEDDPVLEILNPNLLDPTEGPMDDVGVQIIRVIFGSSSVHMAFVTILSLTIWAYGSAVGPYNEKAAIGTMAGLVFITLLFLNWLKKSWVAMFPMVIFLIELSILVGFSAVRLSALAPIQFTVTLFAQSISILGYTTVNTRYIDLKKSTMLLIFVTILCWLIGVFAYIEDEDWILSIITLVGSWLSIIYYILQIKYSNRYHMNQKIEAISNLYTDIIDIIWKFIKITIRMCLIRLRSSRTQIDPSIDSV